MTLGEFLTKLAKKAGVDTTTDDFKPISEISTVIPDAISAVLDKNLMTVQAATSNDDVKKVLRQQILAPIDSKMAELITELGITAPAGFDDEKSTYIKFEQLTRLANEAGKKAKAPGSSTADQKAWEQKETDYNNQIKQLKADAVTQQNTFNSKQATDSVDQDINYFSLSKMKDFIFPEEMDLKLRLTIASGAIKTALAKDGLQIKHDDAGQLIIVDKDGTPAFSKKDNEPIQANTYFDGVYTQNKFLKVSDTDPAEPTKVSPGADQINKGQNQNNLALADEMKAQAATLPA